MRVLTALGLAVITTSSFIGAVACGGDRSNKQVDDGSSIGATGAGDTFVSRTNRIADDLSAFRRLPRVELPAASAGPLTRLIDLNEAGQPLYGRVRLLLQTRGKRLFVVPTSRGYVCSVLDPEQIPNCNGLYRGRPRLYPFYDYDNGLQGRRSKLVVFGLVPDRVRSVDVLVRCRPSRAFARNGGFYFEQTGAAISDVDGFIFRFRRGTPKRQTFNKDRAKPC